MRWNKMRWNKMRWRRWDGGDGMEEIRWYEVRWYEVRWRSQGGEGVGCVPLVP
jgi:hypothetical protein